MYFFLLIASALAGDPIVFGQTVSVSSPDSYGIAGGIRLAFEERNAAGGVLGNTGRLNLTTLEDDGTVASAVANINTLLQLPVLALIGLSGNSVTDVVSSDTFIPANVPVFAPDSAAAILRDPFKRNVVLTLPSRYEEFYALVATAVAYNHNRVAVFAAATTAGTAGLSRLGFAMKPFGLKMKVVRRFIEQDLSNITAAVIGMAQDVWQRGYATPDAIFVIAEQPSVVALLPLVRLQFPDAYVFVPSWARPATMIPQLPSGSRKNVIVTGGLPPVPDPLFQSTAPLHPLVVAYRNASKAFGVIADHTDISDAGLQGYLAGRFLIKVIEDVVPPLTSSALLDTLYQTGVYGVVSLRLGEFCDDASECTPCNQGARTVWVYSLDESSYSLLRTSKTTTCGFPDDEPSPIILGQVARLEAGSGLERRLGMVAAFEQVNDFGGISGRKIALITYSNNDSAIASVNCTRELLEDDDVFALAGYLGAIHVLSVVDALPGIFARIGHMTALVGPFTGAPELMEHPVDYVITTHATFDEEADAALAFLVGAGYQLGRVALSHPADTWGVEYRDAWVRAMSRLGASPVVVVSYSRLGTIPSSSLTPFAALRDQISVVVVAGPGFETFFPRVKLVCDPSTIYFVYVAGSLLRLTPGVADNSSTIFASQAVPAPRPATDEFLIAYQTAVANLRESPLYAPGNLGLEDSTAALEGYVVGALIVSALQRFSRTQELTREGFMDIFYTGDPFHMGHLQLGPWISGCNSGSTQTFITRALPNYTMATEYSRTITRSCWTPSPPVPPPGLSSAIVTALGVGVGSLVLVIIIVAVLTYRRKRKAHYVIDTRGKGVIPFDQLTFIQPIGLGSFGEVFYGMYANSEVAIKRLLKRDISPRDMRTFLAETAITFELRHPSIVLFMGVCTEWPNLCIITEYMERGNLFDNLHRDVDIHKSMMYKWAQDVASGLAYLHGRNVAHQDLKSLNVLMSRDWGCKLCDFGMSQFKDREDNDEGWVGTVFWSSPEVLKNGKSSLKSDIYSFGVVLWEIFSRREPWKGETQHAATIKVIGGKRLPLDGIPAELVPIISRCWETSPLSRPTAEFIRHQLSRMYPSLAEAVVPTLRVRPPLGADGAFVAQLFIHDAGRWYTFDPAGFDAQVDMIVNIVERTATDLRASPVLVDGETFRYLFHSAHDALSFCRKLRDALRATLWDLSPYTRSPSVLLRRRLSTPGGEQETAVESRLTRTAPLPEALQSEEEEEEVPAQGETTAPPAASASLASLISLCAHYGKTVLGKDAQRGAAYGGPTMTVLDRACQAQPVGSVWASEAIVSQTSGWGMATKRVPLEVLGASLLFAVLDELPTDQGRAIDVTGVADADWYLHPSDILVSSAPEERMGVGTYAQVMPALLRQQGVVFKLFANQRLSARDLMRFRKEAAFLCKLSHPNILAIRAVVSFPPRAGIVLPYVRRGSLQVVISDESPRPAKDQLRLRRHSVALQVAEGLAYLHACGVVHGSLKCANVLFDNDWKVLLSDFGLDTLKIAMQTMTHVDKSAWMAPEVINGGSSTVEADVFCFGMLLWSIVSCDEPFKTLTRLGALHKVLQGDTPTPPEGLRSDVVHLLRACWAIRPSERPRMADVVLVLSPLRTVDG